MKRKILCLLLIMLFVFVSSCAIAAQKPSDVAVIESTSQTSDDSQTDDGGLDDPGFNLDPDPGFGIGGNGNDNGGFVEIAPPIAILPLTFDNDMGIFINAVWYPVREDAAPLLSALGDDFVFSSAPSCAFVGEDKEFDYGHCTVFTNPDGQLDIWYLIVLKDNTLQTSRGLKVGDSLDDVIGRYGDNYFWEGADVLYYNISGTADDIESPCILFTIDNNTVTLIEIYYPTNDFE